MQIIKKDNRQARSADRAETIRVAISPAAHAAIAVSSMRLLLEVQGSGCFLRLDQLTVSKLNAAKRPSEGFSDVIIRMAKADEASERSSRYVGAAREQQARFTMSRSVGPSV